MKEFNVKTETGSIYRIRQDAVGRWWVQGENKENEGSKSLTEKWWEITEPYPWPLQIDCSMLLMSKHYGKAKDHPLRMPGGGKRTSHVVEITEV